MRNKLFILIAAASVLVIVGILGLVLVLGGDDAAPENTDTGFGDSAPDRPFDVTAGDRPLSPTDMRSSSTVPVPVLRQLTTEPVGAALVIEREVQGVIEPTARYIERTTGHILDVSLVRMDTATATSLMIIPGIAEAAWAPDASTTLYRYMNMEATTLFTWLGWLTPRTPQVEGEDVSKPPYERKGRYLPENAYSVVLSPNGAQVFFVLRDDTGSRGFIENVQSGARKQVWTSPLREVTATWQAPDLLVIYTNPSSVQAGYVWTLNVKTQATDLALTQVPAATAMSSRDGKHILYSVLEGTLASLRLLDRETGKVTYQSLVTLPEKCVWDTENSAVLYCAVPDRIPRKEEYPEAWYQGRVSFSDLLWKIDTISGATELLAEPYKLTERRMDIVDLALDPKHRYLLFRTKDDGFLWSLTLPAGNTSGTATSSQPF